VEKLVNKESTKDIVKKEELKKLLQKPEVLAIQHPGERAAYLHQNYDVERKYLVGTVCSKNLYGKWKNIPIKPRGSASCLEFLFLGPINQVTSIYSD
jgi:hypothetical protein